MMNLLSSWFLPLKYPEFKTGVKKHIQAMNLDGETNTTQYFDRLDEIVSRIEQVKSN